MDKEESRILKNLSFKLVTEATLKIDDLKMKTTTIIPFCVMMLETTLVILNQAKEHNSRFLEDHPEDLVEEAIGCVVAMFRAGFGRDIEKLITIKKKSKEEITKEVENFLKNLPRGGKDET